MGIPDTVVKEIQLEFELKYNTPKVHNKTLPPRRIITITNAYHVSSYAYTPDISFSLGAGSTYALLTIQTLLQLTFLINFSN